MSRTVPAPLQAHLLLSSTTTTRLLKVKLKTGIVYGITMLDQTLTYDDGTGDGPIDYVASNGFDPSAFSSDTGYSVDNAESYALLSDDIPGVTLEMVEAGELDDGEWRCYLVNFKDLSMGHAVLDGGDLGEVFTKFGVIWIPELLSYMMRLRQPIGGVWSRTCRATFGTPADSQTGCGVDATALWVNGTVSAVGAETDRIFDGTGVTVAPAGYPRRVQWLTGANAGREYATEDLDGDTITLSETTAYAVEVGDTYRIRDDCDKRYVPDCITRYANGPNFKGEPLIPVGDALSIMTPGGQLPGGGGYGGAVPDEGGDSP